MKISDEAKKVVLSLMKEQGGWKTQNAMTELIQVALDAERERCAKICESRGRFAIAAQIREGPIRATIQPNG